MASDRARISHDPKHRGWRSVVFQQGRVQIEADSNEAWEIESDARREEILDIVGPCGTPDDGYLVTPQAGALKIGKGTMYLGGWRLELEADVFDNAQPDWKDAPPYVPVSGNEVVLLRASEQEVTAVEDPALREVALGGPDTAARTRLLQHFLRVPVKGRTCAQAQGELAKLLNGEDLTLDPHSLQLLSGARLKVDFVPPTPPPGPCDPPAQGGYLGADNQLIRVTVIRFDPATKKGVLLWGYNNASFLHRAITDPQGALTLLARPLDGEHEPQPGKPVEVLRARIDMGSGCFVAAPEGEVRAVSAYDPDTRQMTLVTSPAPATPLPAEYVGTVGAPLFVRLWERQVEFTSGQPAVLDETGLTVTIAMQALPTIAGRPFWRFAVRPSTPIAVYPARYAAAGQPPDGPRQWLCRLAVVGMNARKDKEPQLLDDCRLHFEPLVKHDHGDCCGVVIDPAKARMGLGLQAIIDAVAEKGGGKVSLKPGRYTLPEPLRLDARHDGLVFEGCQDGAVLEADDDNLEAFGPGLVIVDHADAVTFRNLRFEMPLASIEDRLDVFRGELKAAARVDKIVSVGIQAIHSPRLRVEGCLFRYRLAEQSPMIAVGIYGRGECWGFTLKDTSFLHDDAYMDRDNAPFRYLMGYALAPETPKGVRPNARMLAEAEEPVGDALLGDAEISGNRFAGLTVASAVLARLDAIRCTDNRVIDCLGGFYFMTSDMGATLQLIKSLSHRTGATAVAPAPGIVNIALIDLLSHLGLLIPRPPTSPYSTARKPTKAVFTTTVLRLVAEEFRRIAAESLKVIDAAADPKNDAEKLAGAGAKENVAYITDISRATMVATAARVAARSSLPALHIRGNDIRIRGKLTDKIEEPQGDPLAVSYAGISVVFEVGEGDACVMVQDNRVRVASPLAPAVGVLFGEYVVVTSNMLIQNLDRQSTPATCLTVFVEQKHDDFPRRIDVMANLVTGKEDIQPPRHASAPVDHWDFVNEAR